MFSSQMRNGPSFIRLQPRTSCYASIMKVSKITAENSITGNNLKMCQTYYVYLNSVVVYGHICLILDTCTRYLSNLWVAQVWPDLPNVSYFEWSLYFLFFRRCLCFNATIGNTGLSHAIGTFSNGRTGFSFFLLFWRAPIKFVFVIDRLVIFKSNR